MSAGFELSKRSKAIFMGRTNPVPNFDWLTSVSTAKLLVRPEVRPEQSPVAVPET